MTSGNGPLWELDSRVRSAAAAVRGGQGEAVGQLRVERFALGHVPDPTQGGAIRHRRPEDPSRARLVDEEGITPLWWLPDDEAKAMQIVELLLAAGADPSLKSTDGRTAADWARRRGMREVAERLSRA